MPDQPTDMPDGFPTQTTANAVQLHELYMSYVDVGFTTAQAFELFLAIVKAQLRREVG